MENVIICQFRDYLNFFILLNARNNKEQNTAVLAPGKGWGNFVSYISCFKQISDTRQKKIILITKKFSSAEAYLEDQNFISKFINIQSNSRGAVRQIKLVFELMSKLRSASISEIFIFHSSALMVILCYLSGIKKVYAPGIGIQNLFLKKEYKFYESYKSNLINQIDESMELTNKILKIDNCSFTTLHYRERVDPLKIMVCMASSGPSRQWGTENFIKLINYLKTKGFKKFVILSGTDQIEKEKQIMKKTGDDIELILTAEKTIKEVIPHIKTSSIYIGHDTGFSHLALAYGKKSFILFGDCEPSIYTDLIVPIDKEEDVPRSDESIRSISFEKVKNIFEAN